MIRGAATHETLDLDALPPLPAQWKWSIASDICNVIASGSTPTSDKMYPGNGDVPFIKVYNLTNNGSLDFTVKPTFVDRATHIGLLARSRVIPNDVLINIVGPPLGKVSIVPSNYPEWNINQAIVVFRPRDGISYRYLTWALMSDSVMNRLTSRAKATAGQFNIGVGMCRSLLPIPIAPSAEQHRIVANIEELFSDLDAGVTALQRVKAKLKRYRAALLKAAVEGRLTAEWRAKNPPKETGPQLLQRVLKERRSKWEAEQLAAFEKPGKKPPTNWKAKYKEPANADVAGLPELPDGWCWANVAQIAEMCLGKMLDKAKHTTGTKLPYLRNINVRWWKCDLSDLLEMYFDDDELDRFGLRPGDVLVCEGGEPGRAAVWAAQMRDVKFQKAIHRLRFARGIEPTFVIALLEHWAKSQFLERFFTGSTIKHFTGESFARMPFTMPPSDEQAMIVSEVDERLSLIVTAELQIDANLKRSARLRQSILKRAFEGKLVPQDPADEPAAALLPCIRETHCVPARPDGATAPTQRTAPPRKQFIRRASIVAYTIRRLAANKSFGRTQLEKTLHIAQSHLGINLELVFERYQAGPFDKTIYKVEGVAKKNDWCTTRNRPDHGVSYHPGSKIDEICKYAHGILGAKQIDFDRLLDDVSKMNTDQAELFATAYAAWNDLIIDGRPTDDQAITAEIHGWHESKKRFTPDKVLRCLEWMREHRYVPTGQGQRTKQPDIGGNGPRGRMAKK